LETQNGPQLIATVHHLNHWWAILTNTAVHQSLCPLWEARRHPYYTILSLGCPFVVKSKGF